jgi:sulfate-transporting ATPase
MMVGQEQPDAGTIEVGSTVAFAYVDQSRDDLNAENTVFDEISEGQEQHGGRQPRDSRARLRGEFRFQG